MNKGQEIDVFSAGWNWEEIFSVWRERMRKFAVPLEPLFKEMVIKDPLYKDLDQWQIWWPNKYRLDLQVWNVEYPINYIIDGFNYRRGEMDTLYFLWRHKDSVEKVAAVLISASLFARTGNERVIYPEKNWPPERSLRMIKRWVRPLWVGGWHNWNTQVLPEINDDFEADIHDMKTLINYLADEHASVLLNHTPVSVICGGKRKTVERMETQLIPVSEVRKLEKIVKKEVAPIVKTPKWSERLSKEELERLVWSKSTVTLAQEFGVSNVAIAKHCKKLGITKPWPGFWREVETGKRPYPNGKPVHKDYN